MGKAIFITATSTNIGKTVIAAILCNILCKNKKRVSYYKPIQTGCYLKENLLIGPDSEFVFSTNKFINCFTTYLLKEPCSPHLAARLEKKEISLDKIKNDYSNIKNNSDFIVIEGAGGIIVPLNEKGLFIYHIPLKLKLPVILISKASLGAINQVSLSYNFLKRLNIKITAIILLYQNSKPTFIELDNQEILKKILNFKNIYLLPEVKNCDTETMTIGNIFEVIDKYPDIKIIQEWFK